MKRRRDDDGDDFDHDETKKTKMENLILNLHTSRRNEKLVYVKRFWVQEIVVVSAEEQDIQVVYFVVKTLFCCSISYK